MSHPDPDRYAVLGNPVAHSQSPFIHAEFARQTGEALVYDRVLCPIEGFAKAVRDFAAAGARGCNVTVPFKFEVPALAARVTPRAALAQAANTLRFEPEEAGGWLADNTDGIGLVRDITVHAATPLQGRRILLVGAGGAAAGVLGPLLEAGPSEIVLTNRTAERANALVSRHQAMARELDVALNTAPQSAPGESFDVVINASSSSLQAAQVPVPRRVLKPQSLAVDLMYGAAAEPFLRWAREADAAARDGLGMLVEQAAEAFWIWRGVRPQTAPVLAALRERLALGKG